MIQLKKAKILRKFLIKSFNLIYYKKKLALVVRMIPHLLSYNVNKKISGDFSLKLRVTNEALLGNA